MLNLRKLAGWAVVASLCASLAYVGMLLIPALKAKTRHTKQAGEPYTEEVIALTHEVRRLQRLLREQKQPENEKQVMASGIKLPIRTQGKVNEVVLDLHKLLGSAGYFGGISFDTYQCGVPLEKAFPGITPEQLDNLVKNFQTQLATAMAEVLGKSQVHTNSSWLDELVTPGLDRNTAMNMVVSDPRTSAWSNKLTNVMARFMVSRDGHSFLQCQETQTQLTLEDFGKIHCPTFKEHEVVQRVGYHPLPFIPLIHLAHDALKWGVCTKDPMMKGSYGQWLLQERMFNDQWKTFKTPSLEEDAVIFLFDILYEQTNAFKQQYWLGSIMMQNPFDMLAITDIIHTVRPDLIIETGTANGGSALLWASIMHLEGIENGRVITVDVSPPTWDPSQQHWGGVVRSDATKHALWKKHVTFIQGSSISEEVYQQIRKAANEAQNVLVLLDSHHTLKHVKQEVELYCPLVTFNSYCLIEDTKLTRFASDGPMLAGIAYAKKYPDDFILDRTPEPLFTHHAQGYLKRKAVVDVAAWENTSALNSL